ncbi:MAG: hypothetical protein N3B21_00605 [Clostridia bacterium]|nr:hypothetical protein [Clostridia bacterium]
MFKRWINVLLLLFLVLMSFSACNNKGQNKSLEVTSLETTSQMVEGSNKAISTSVDTGKSSTDTQSGNDEKSIDSSNEEAYKKETMMLHCVLLESIALKNNAMIPALTFSDNYVNIISGEKKQGLNQKYFEKYLAGNNIYKVDSISKLADYKNIETLTYDEIMKSPERYFVNNKANFQYEKEDVLVIIHPTKGSSLKYGWVGIYRMKDEQRKMVAGSF